MGGQNDKGSLKNFKLIRIIIIYIYIYIFPYLFSKNFRGPRPPSVSMWLHHCPMLVKQWISCKSYHGCVLYYKPTSREFNELLMEVVNYMSRAGPKPRPFRPWPKAPNMERPPNMGAVIFFFFFGRNKKNVS